MFLAIVNTPGYLPDSEPVEFETAGEAWAYLEDLRNEHEASVSEDGYFVASDCLSNLRMLAEEAGVNSIFVNSVGEGEVYGETPGYDGENDLGLVYSVSRETS